MQANQSVTAHAGSTAAISAQAAQQYGHARKRHHRFQLQRQPARSLVGRSARGHGRLVDRIDRYPDPGHDRSADGGRPVFRHQAGAGRLRERLERADPPHPPRVQTAEGPDPGADLFGICLQRSRLPAARSYRCRCRSGPGFGSIRSKWPLRSRAWTWHFSAIRTIPRGC